MASTNAPVTYVWTLIEANRNSFDHFCMDLNWSKEELIRSHMHGSKLKQRKLLTIFDDFQPFLTFFLPIITVILQQVSILDVDDDNTICYGTVVEAPDTKKPFVVTSAKCVADKQPKDVKKHILTLKILWINRWNCHFFVFFDHLKHVHHPFIAIIIFGDHEI